MSLFNQILNAVNNPQQEASLNQLGGILDTVQQLSNNSQTNSTNIQSAMSVVGNFTRSALQQQRQTNGNTQVNQLIDRFAGNRANPQALSMLFSNAQIQQMVQQINRTTGLDSQTIMTLIPILVPLVLNILKTGNSKANSPAHQSNASKNSVLDSFLDADGDGDVDVSDAVNMAFRHLGR
jgi:hypothetical protein